MALLPVNYNPSDSTAEAEETLLAASVLGGYARDVVPYFNDFGSGDFTGTNAFCSGTGTAAASTTRRSCLEIASGATASSQGFYTLRPGSVDQPIIPDGTGGEWYMSARFRPNLGTIDGPTALSVLASAAEDANVGVYGSVSTTKFAAQLANGSAITSTVDIANAEWFTLRLWRRSGATYLSVNNEAPVAGDTYTTAFGPLSAFVRNGATASNRAASIDWVYVACGRLTA